MSRDMAVERQQQVVASPHAHLNNPHVSRMSDVAEHDRPVPGTAHLRQRRATAQRGDVKGIEGSFHVPFLVVQRQPLIPGAEHNTT
jgi:hypothetical protein